MVAMEVRQLFLEHLSLMLVVAVEDQGQAQSRLVAVAQVAVGPDQIRQVYRLLLEQPIPVVVEAAVALKTLPLLMAAQADQASSFSNGPSHYRPQIPLHLPVHG
jgi:hypothetical protein